MKLSIESEALVMPRRSGVPSAGSPPAVYHLLVLFHEAESVDLLVHEEVRIADSRQAN
jgi:hypothetical protein